MIRGKSEQDPQQFFINHFKGIKTILENHKVVIDKAFVDFKLVKGMWLGDIFIYVKFSDNKADNVQNIIDLKLKLQEFCVDKGFSCSVFINKLEICGRAVSPPESAVSFAELTQREPPAPSAT